MDYILYLLIFCIGTVFGSFFTLAVYRIPLRQDITHTRSYCPHCNHKLSFWDMIPIFSYVFLGGKCRYCKEKIRPRYLLLEVFSGIVFVLFALSVKLSIFSFNTSVLMYVGIGILYITTLFIIAGIDKEKFKVEKPVLLFGFICVTAYMIYLYIVEGNPSMYRYVIYLIIACILTILDTVYLRKKLKNSYVIDILLLSILMIIFSYELVYICTVIVTLIAIALQLILHKLDNIKSKCIKVDKTNNSEIPIAFYMCVANILIMIASNMYIFYL